MAKSSLKTAKQTFGATPSVTVRFVAADDSASGAYALSLPTGAPLFSQYVTGWTPTALAAQTGVAGKYTVESSATGYKTQSAQFLVLGQSTLNRWWPSRRACCRRVPR